MGQTESTDAREDEEGYARLGSDDNNGALDAESKAANQRIAPKLSQQGHQLLHLARRMIALEATMASLLVQSEIHGVDGNTILTDMLFSAWCGADEEHAKVWAEVMAQRARVSDQELGMILVLTRGPEKRAWP